MFFVLIFMTCGVWCSEVIPVPYAWDGCLFNREVTVFKVFDLPEGMRKIEVACYPESTNMSDSVTVANERQTMYCSVFNCGFGLPGILMDLAAISEDAEVRQLCYAHVLVVNLSVDEAILEFLEPKKGDRVQVVNIDRSEAHAFRDYGPRATARQCRRLFSVTENELTVTKLLNPYGSENKAFFVKACFTYADLSKAVMQWGVHFLSGFEVVRGQCPLDL